MQRLLIRMIHVYRRLLSPLIGRQCRFTPSCSRYTEQAIELYGAGRGSWMGVKRILRCQPFCDGGWDPVPGSDAEAALNEPRHDPGSDAEAALNEPIDNTGSDAETTPNGPGQDSDDEPREAKRSERGGSETDSDDSARAAPHRRRRP